MIELKDSDKFRFTDTDKKHLHEAFIDGKWTEVPGCTSVSGLFSEDGWKFAWPVKLMAEKILEGLKEIFKATVLTHTIEKNIIELVLKAKNAWREKRDKAADSGTIAHRVIEDYIKQQLTVVVFPNEEVRNCWNTFKDWETKNKPKWLASEIQVGSITHKYCGILDALALIDDKVTLVDFKTSSGIKDEYSIQLIGLQICLEEQGVKIDQRAILHLPKEGEFEWKILNGNTEEEKKDFIAGLEFYRRKNLFKGRNR